MASDGSLLEYTEDDASNNRTSKTSGGKTYTRTLVSEAMSAIKQEADKVSILVGTDGNVKASVIADAINEGGSVSINANKINLLGETITTAINAAEISADQITTGTLNANRIASNSITADKLAANALTANSINTSAGSNGVSTKIQEGIFEISGCSNAKIAFGIDENCVPYMYLTDANGNEIWRATNQGFNFSGTVTAPKIKLYPGLDNLLGITSTDSFYSDGFTYSAPELGGWNQYYQYSVGGVSKSSTLVVVDDERQLTSNIIGYFTPYNNTTKLVVPAPKITGSSTISLNKLVYKPTSTNGSIYSPDVSNVIPDGLYISSVLHERIVSVVTTHNNDSSLIREDYRIQVPLRQFVDGKLVGTVTKYKYGDSWSNGSGSEYSVTEPLTPNSL